MTAHIIGETWLDILPKRFRWTPHNLVAHPLSEILFQLGYAEPGNKVHDATIPLHYAGDGRDRDRDRDRGRDRTMTIFDSKRKCVYVTSATDISSAIQLVQNDQWIESLDPETVTRVGDFVRCEIVDLGDV